LKSLPAWVKVSFDVNKTELKKAEELPAGASLVTNQSLQIR